MTRFLRDLSSLTFWLGCLLSLPGILLLMASEGLASVVVDREQQAHDRALDQEIL